ncbi:MAG: hypothetical protein H6838_01505 [Planctomycetes bacterium]|nr:hypothetical protein [Planctomycetota bacterium]MCB9884133.1 hypothetical protein [Planctomycetota bacterium]
MTVDGDKRPQRLAASYVLTALFFVVVIVAWLRGAGRFLLPLLLLAGVAVLVRRVVRKIKEPLP